MKHGKKPTREQKMLMKQWRLNPENWLVERDTPEKMVIVHRHFDNKTRTIRKDYHHEKDCL